MTAIQERVYEALFALLQPLQTSGAVTTLDRRLRPLQKLNTADFPAVILALGSEQVTRNPGFPPTRLLTAHLYLFARAPTGTSPQPALHALQAAVEGALESAPLMGMQQLGIPVEHAWIEGHIEKWEDLENPVAAALMPVQILLP